MPRLILDAMGGDYGPRVILEGVVQALPELLASPGELVILGDQQVIRSYLKKRRYQALAQALDKPSSSPFRISLLHAAEAIHMEDSIQAIRSKPNATINVGCQLAAESYASTQGSVHRQSSPLDLNFECPAVFISAGHSGAIMASSLLYMGRLANVERPAIAIKLPTLGKDGCVLIDAGANVDCKPHHLRDFAIMGALYAQAERINPELPRVALLSNGEERKKGNDLIRSARDLIENLPFFQGSQALGKFIGYAEGKEIFKGQVDVVVTDGFVGNVVLKAVEGLGSAVVTILKQEAKWNPFTSIGYLLSASVFAKFKKKLDYAEYGAAPLLGVAGYVFICHGRSNPKAIKNALLRARAAVKSQFIERLEQALDATPIQTEAPDSPWSV